MLSNPDAKCGVVPNRGTKDMDNPVFVHLHVISLVAQWSSVPDSLSGDVAFGRRGLKGSVAPAVKSRGKVKEKAV